MPHDEDRVRADQPAHDEHRGQRGDADRRQGLQGVAADDQLEGIKGAGQRRVEGRRDGPGGAAPDQGAHVVAAQPDAAPEPRGQRRAKLGIGRFEPDRCAKPAGEDRHPNKAEAVAERHPPAEQRVRLDRVDHLARAPAAQQQRAEADEQAADNRRRHQAGRGQRGGAAQMTAERDGESKVPDEVEQQVGGNDAKTGGDPGAKRQHQQKQLAVAQPRFGAAGPGGRGLGLFSPGGGCDLGHAPAIGEFAAAGKGASRAKLARSPSA